MALEYIGGSLEPPDSMVDFQTYMSIALKKCAPNGRGSQSERRRVFGEFVSEWNENKSYIKGLDESELEQRIECP